MLLEMKSELSDNERQSELRMSNFCIIDQIIDEEDARVEQEILTEHELKVINLIDRIGKLMRFRAQLERKKTEKRQFIATHGLGGIIL